MERNGGEERVGKRREGEGDWRREQNGEEWSREGMQGGESKQDGERGWREPGG